MVAINFEKAANTWDRYADFNDAGKTEFIAKHWLHTDGTVSSKWKWVRALETVCFIKYFHRMFCKLDLVQTGDNLSKDIKNAFNKDILNKPQEYLDEIKNKNDEADLIKKGITTLKAQALYLTFLLKSANTDENRTAHQTCLASLEKLEEAKKALGK